MAVTVALTDNFPRELGSEVYIREGVVNRIWIKVGGSKVESKLYRWARVIIGRQQDFKGNLVRKANISVFEKQQKNRI